MALVLTQTADPENPSPEVDSEAVQPSLELLLHLAQWETADGQFMDPMLLSEDEDPTAADDPQTDPEASDNDE